MTAGRWDVSRTEEASAACLKVWDAKYSTCRQLVYLRGLFATGWGGGAAGGGQGGGAGLWGTFLTGGGHLVQAVLPGRVGLYAAGGRRVLESQHDKLYCRAPEYNGLFNHSVF